MFGLQVGDYLTHINDCHVLVIQVRAKMNSIKICQENSFFVKPLKLLTFQGCCRCGCYCRCNGVDFDEFILYNVQMTTVTFLPTIEGNRTFELELALKTKLQEVTSFV